jgi:hypothetical protein
MSFAARVAMAQNDRPPPNNSMGDVINNRGIVTQGQVGNNTIVNPVHREADGVYQGDNKVGKAPPPSIDTAAGTATFRFIGFNTYPDRTQPLEYGDLILQCDNVPQQRPNVFAATVSIAVAGLQCKIVGRK